MPQCTIARWARAFGRDLCNLANFFFRQRKFADDAVARVVSSEFKSNEQLRAAYPDGKLPEDKVAEWHQREQARAREVRGHIRRAGCIAIGTAAAAAVVARAFGSMIQPYVTYLQVASAILILWAILGKLGWPFGTWCGTTPSEQINDSWFWKLTVSGTFLLLLSMFAQAFGDH